MAVYRQSPASNYGVPPMWYSSIASQYYQSKEAAEAAEAEAKNTPEYKAQQEKEQAVSKLTKQILAQGTTDKWSGEGFGSAEANAKSMAETLANVGITDISQFGKVPQYSDVKPIAWESMGQKVYLNPGHGYYKFSPVQQGYDDQGNPYFPQQRLTAEEERNVKPTQYGVYAIDPTAEYGTGEYYKPISNDDLVTVDGVLKAKTGEVFGNKATGQALNSDWKVSDPNAFSGTTAGSGFTNFAVQFAPDGTPYFYSYYGGSSSDFGSIAPILGIGLMFAPGLQGIGATIGSALAPAANAAIQAGIGNAIVQGAISEATGGDFLKGAALSGIGSLAGGIQPGLSEALGGGTVGNIASNALIGGTMAELSGGDFAQGALLSGISSGIDEAKLAARQGAFENAMTESGLAGQTSITQADWDALNAPYVPTTDFNVTPNYSLATGASGAPGLILKPIDTEYQVGSFNYTLGDLIEGLGLQMPSTLNLESMDGGQGIVLNTKGGYITEQGFIPDSYVASLGDPESFINKPVIDVNLSLPELQQATPEDISAKLAALDIAKALTPAALAALTKKVIDTIGSEQASGFAMVPVPSDWKSPEYNMAFTPSAPIDFGTRELLRGTQWENPQITFPNTYELTNLINTLNMESVPFVQQNYDFTLVPLEVPDILQQFNVAPTVAATDVIGNLNNQPVSIADIIAGIQSGQNYSS